MYSSSFTWVCILWSVYYCTGMDPTVNIPWYYAFFQRKIKSRSKNKNKYLSRKDEIIVSVYEIGPGLVWNDDHDDDDYDDNTEYSCLVVGFFFMAITWEGMILF